MTRPPVKVLLFQPSSVFGGAERSALNVVHHLDPARVHITLLGSEQVFGDVSGCAFVSTRSLGVAEGFAGLRRALGDARAIARLARACGCEVVIGFLHYGAIIAALVRVVSFGRVKGIASPRTPSRKAVRQLVGERGARVRLWHAMIHFFCRAANRLIVASEGLKRECVESYGARARHVAVVPNGVDGDLVARATATAPVRAQDPAAPFRVVSFGRLVPEKDLGTLVRGFAAFAQGHPHSELWFVGDGREREALAALAATLGVADKVCFHGFQPLPFAWVKSCDVFVHTALYEGFGNVILEAMACGVAVIATDCDFGPREIVQDGVNGLLAPPSDAGALAACLERLAGDEALRLRLAAAARDRVAAFSARNMAKGYQAVFLELVRGESVER